MRIGLSSFCYRYAVNDTFAPLGAVEMLRKAAALGVDLLQVCDNLPLDALSDDELDEVQRVAAALGVAIEVGTSGLDPDHLARYVALADRFGSRALRLVLGSDDVALASERLRAILPALEEAGVVLAIENHFDLPSPQLVALIEALDSGWVGICLDTANSVGLVEPPLETVAALSPFARQVHLKDYLVERAPIGYHVTGRALGEGWLDANRVLALLGERAGELDYMAELWMDPAETREETLAQEERWIARSVAALRALLSS